MSIVAPPTHDRNVALAPSPDALQHLSTAMTARIALAQALPAVPTDGDYTAFMQFDAQVQAQMDAWALTLADCAISA